MLTDSTPRLPLSPSAKLATVNRAFRSGPPSQFSSQESSMLRSFLTGSAGLLVLTSFALAGTVTCELTGMVCVNSEEEWDRAIGSCPKS